MPYGPYENLRVGLREDGVLHLELDRPRVRNAFNEELISELEEAFGQSSSDEGVRAVLLTGRGKCFSAGADIDWMRGQGELDQEANAASARRMAGMFQAIYACRKPVVAGIHGAALGGGTGLAAVADIAVAEEDCLFGFTEVRLGILPAVISPYAVEKIGPARARALFMLGSRFDGREAERIGLVFRACPKGRLREETEALLSELARSGPRAVCEAKALALGLSPRPPAADLEETARKIAAIRSTAEAREGLQAFLERRQPRWASGKEGP